jgi:hypothetical protein
LREQVESQFTQQRLTARLTSFFGILSLVLASIGLYGVTAYNAGRRVQEIGVRMALGADRGHVIRLVLRGAFGLILAGLSIGVAIDVRGGAIPGQPALRSQSDQSGRDVGGGGGAWLLGPGGVVDPRRSSEFDIAAGRAASGVTGSVLVRSDDAGGSPEEAQGESGAGD